MKITVLTVGKIKEKYLRDAIAEYTKRLSRYCKLEIIEVADEKTPDNASENAEEMIRQKEAERLLKYIREDAYLITLEIGGKQLTSEEFSEKIEKLGIQGTSHIIFVIGGSIGIGKAVLEKSDYALSFSKMTFPHQLMRVILPASLSFPAASLHFPSETSPSAGSSSLFPEETVQSAFPHRNKVHEPSHFLPGQLQFQYCAYLTGSDDILCPRPDHRY